MRGQDADAVVRLTKRKLWQAEKSDALSFTQGKNAAFAKCSNAKMLGQIFQEETFQMPAVPSQQDNLDQNPSFLSLACFLRTSEIGFPFFHKKSEKTKEIFLFSVKENT